MRALLDKLLEVEDWFAGARRIREHHLRPRVT